MRCNERVFNYSYFRVGDGLTLDLKLGMQSKAVNLFNQHRKHVQEEADETLTNIFLF